MGRHAAGQVQDLQKVIQIPAAGQDGFFRRLPGKDRARSIGPAELPLQRLGGSRAYVIGGGMEFSYLEIYFSNMLRAAAAEG